MITKILIVAIIEYISDLSCETIKNHFVRGCKGRCNPQSGSDPEGIESLGKSKLIPSDPHRGLIPSPKGINPFGIGSLRD